MAVFNMFILEEVLGDKNPFLEQTQKGNFHTGQDLKSWPVWKYKLNMYGSINFHTFYGYLKLLNYVPIFSFYLKVASI